MAKSNKELQADFRARKKAEGLVEIRGIFAPKKMHEQIKEMVTTMVEPPTDKKGVKNGKE